MQTRTTSGVVVIEDYYHMTIMDESINWMKLTHLLSTFPLNLRVAFYAYLEILDTLLKCTY